MTSIAETVIDIARRNAETCATATCCFCGGTGVCMACRPFEGEPRFAIEDESARPPERQPGRCSACGEGRCQRCRENPGKCGACKGSRIIVDEQRRIEMYICGLLGAASVAHGQGDSLTVAAVLDEGLAIWKAGIAVLPGILERASESVEQTCDNHRAPGSSALTTEELRDLGIEPEG